MKGDMSAHLRFLRRFGMFGSMLWHVLRSGIRAIRCPLRSHRTRNWDFLMSGGQEKIPELIILREYSCAAVIPWRGWLPRAWLENLEDSCEEGDCASEGGGRGSEEGGGAEKAVLARGMKGVAPPGGGGTPPLSLVCWYEKLGGGTLCEEVGIRGVGPLGNGDEWIEFALNGESGVGDGVADSDYHKLK